MLVYPLGTRSGTDGEDGEHQKSKEWERMVRKSRRGGDIPGWKLFLRQSWVG
jgi:hypothetical protein